MATKRFVAYVSAVAALGGLLFGYDTGVISGAILFIGKTFPMSIATQSLVVSSVLLGAIAGSAFGGAVADRFGRRLTMLCGGTTFAVGALATGLTPNIEVLVAGRIVVGLAIGVVSVAAPLYISEVAPREKRGALVALNQLAITIGILASFVVDYALAGIEGWRWMFGLAVVPALLLVTGMLGLPETPRWLVRAGAREKARTILSRTRPPEAVEPELRDIDQSLIARTAPWHQLFSPELRPAMTVGIALAIFQQVTGINTVIYYGPLIFKLAGFTSDAGSILAQVGVGVVNVGLTVVSIRLIDRLGRRPLLIGGMLGMAAGLVMLGLTFAFPQAGALGRWLAVLSLMFYVGSFAIGLGPVFWLLISEIYPLTVRGRAMSIATLCNWGGNFAVSLVFLQLIKGVGEAFTFCLYAAVTLLGVAFVRAFVPETKGRSLEDIEATLRA